MGLSVKSSLPGFNGESVSPGRPGKARLVQGSGAARPKYDVEGSKRWPVEARLPQEGSVKVDTRRRSKPKGSTRCVRDRGGGRPNYSQLAWNIISIQDSGPRREIVYEGR